MENDLTSPHNAGTVDTTAGALRNVGATLVVARLVWSPGFSTPSTPTCTTTLCVERVRSELFTLPFLQVKDTEKITKELLSTGVTLEHMADYWNEATAEERSDIVWSLLNAEGIVYDLERQIIIGLKPRASVLPVLALGLEATLMWEQREDGLWLREDYWPPNTS